MTIPSLKAAFTTAQITSLKNWISNAITAAINAYTIPQATESLLGGGMIATLGDVDAGTDDEKIMTVLKTKYGFISKLDTSNFVEGGSAVDMTTLNGIAVFDDSIPGGNSVAFTCTNPDIEDTSYLIIGLKVASNEVGIPVLYNYSISSNVITFLVQNTGGLATNHPIEIHYQSANL